MHNNLIKVSLGVFVVLVISFLFFQKDQFACAETQIPSWLKNQIKDWSVNQASDDDFINSLSELSKLGLIKVQGDVKNKNTYHLPKYGQTIFVKISGRTGDFEQTSPVTLVVVTPNGQESEYTIQVLESSVYSTVIPITYDSPLGTYTVLAYHLGKELPRSYFQLRSEQYIPAWIKETARWLAEGKISDRDFVLSMQYLIDSKVIDLGPVMILQESFDVSVNGLKAVRRGTMQSLDIHVSNVNGPVDGATVSVRVENYGENVLEEFDGTTDSNGDYNVSWELSKDFNDIETFLVFVDVTDGVSSKTNMFKFQVYCLCGEPNCRCRN